MLDITASIICGLAFPIKAEHVTFLRTVLMPMHGTIHLEYYHPQLAYCIIQYVRKSAEGPPDTTNRMECVIAQIVLNGLLRYWPKCNSAKEVMFMNELEEFVDAMTAASFAECRTVMHPLMRATIFVPLRAAWGVALPSRLDATPSFTVQDRFVRYTYIAMLHCHSTIAMELS